MNPVTVEMLREDWVDDPRLGVQQREYLLTLTETTLQDALDAAFSDYEDVWCCVLDNTRSAATSALLDAAYGPEE